MPMASRLWRPSAVGFSTFRAPFMTRKAQQNLHSFPRTFTTRSRLRSAEALIPATELPEKKSFLRRALGVVAIAIFFTGGGFIMAALPAIKTANELLSPPTDEETLHIYTPSDDLEREIEEFIKNHPVSVELRSRPQFIEARPHLKFPEPHKNHNLTAGTLTGKERVSVPPYVWSERGGKSLVSIFHLGKNLSGHPGIVHGGMIATLLDEGLARCCFAALPNKIGVTANLNINYRAPAMAENFFVLRAKTTRVEGRKAWVEGHIETLVPPGEKPLIVAEATALFIEPRQAATMARVYPVN